MPSFRFTRLGQTAPHGQQWSDHYIHPYTLLRSCTPLIPTLQFMQILPGLHFRNVGIVAWAVRHSVDLVKPVENRHRMEKSRTSGDNDPTTGQKALVPD